MYASIPSREVAGVQASLVDTRIPSDTRASLQERHEDRFEGTLHLSFVGRLESWNNHSAAGLDFSCDRRFDVEGASSGPNGGIFELTRMKSELAAHVGFTTTLAQGARWDGLAIGPFAELFLSTTVHEDTAFWVSASTPEGKHQFSGGGNASFKHGTGPYSLEIEAFGNAEAQGLFSDLTQAHDMRRGFQDEPVVVF